MIVDIENATGITVNQMILANSPKQIAKWKLSGTQKISDVFELSWQVHPFEALLTQMGDHEDPITIELPLRFLEERFMEVKETEVEKTNQFFCLLSQTDFMDQYELTYISMYHPEMESLMQIRENAEEAVDMTDLGKVKENVWF